MHIELHIGKLMISRKPIDYTGFETTEERQDYQEREASNLYERNLQKIKQCYDDPVFYIDHVQSKINKGEYDELDWKELISQNGSAVAKENKSLIRILNATQEVAVIPSCVKAAKKHLSPVKETKPLLQEQKFERIKGNYSNVQWKDLDEGEYDN